MNVLLLGAGGFIGVNLAERLLRDGIHETVALDIQEDKISEIRDIPGLQYHHLDISRDEAKVDALVQASDVVVDLVAVANPALYVEDPVGVYDLNFTQNLKVVEQCRRHKKHLIQFSTCEVYGITAAKAMGLDSRTHPIPFIEDETPLIMGPVKNHRWIYACAKQLLERVLHAYGLRDDFGYSIIRPFNFIGPRIDYLPSEAGGGNPRVFSHFMNALLYGTPMKLVDGGVNFRAYTYIDDAVDCMVRIIDNKDGAARKQIFNIGTPENETTIAEFAVKMKEIFNKHFRQPGDPDPEIISVSSEDFYGKGYEDCDRRIPNVDKARNLLGWRSKHDLDSVIYHTMKYFVDKHRTKQAAAATA
jgi:UDP-apiose/xylose synthase